MEQIDDQINQIEKGEQKGEDTKNQIKSNLIKGERKKSMKKVSWGMANILPISDKID